MMSSDKKKFDMKALLDYESKVSNISKDINDFKKIEEQIAQLMALKNPENVKSIYDANKRNRMWDKKDYVYKVMTELIEESIKSGNPIMSTYIQELVELKKMEKKALLYKVNDQLEATENMREKVNGRKSKEIEEWEQKKLSNMGNEVFRLKKVKKTGLVGEVKESIAKWKLIKNITKIEYRKMKGQSQEQKEIPSYKESRRKRILYKILHSKVTVVTLNITRKIKENLKTYNRLQEMNMEYNKRASKVNNMSKIKKSMPMDKDEI